MANEEGRVEVLPARVTEETNMKVDLEMKVTRDDIVDAVISEEEELLEELFSEAHGNLALALEPEGEACRAVKDKLKALKSKFEKEVEKKLRAKHKKLLTALKNQGLKEKLEFSQHSQLIPSDERLRLEREINELLWPEDYKVSFRRKRGVNYSDWRFELNNRCSRQLFGFDTTILTGAVLTLYEDNDNPRYNEGVYVQIVFKLSQEEVSEITGGEDLTLEYVRTVHELAQRFALARDEAITLGSMGKRAKGAMVKQFLGTTQQGQKILGSIDSVRRRGARLLELTGAPAPAKKAKKKAKKKRSRK